MPSLNTVEGGLPPPPKLWASWRASTKNLSQSADSDFDFSLSPREFTRTGKNQKTHGSVFGGFFPGVFERHKFSKRNDLRRKKTRKSGKTRKKAQNSLADIPDFPPKGAVFRPKKARPTIIMDLGNPSTGGFMNIDTQNVDMPQGSPRHVFSQNLWG